LHYTAVTALQHNPIGYGSGSGGGGGGEEAVIIIIVYNKY